VLATEQALEVHVVQRVFDDGQRLLHLGDGFGVALGSELEIELRLFEVLALLAPGDQRRIEEGALAQQRLRRFGIAPKVRRAGLGIELLNPAFPSGEVKDTSRTRRGAFRGQRRGPSVH
jgi:hypothetical protein